MKLPKPKWNFGSRSGTFLKTFFNRAKKIFFGCSKSILSMSKRERYLALVLSVIMIFLIVVKINNIRDRDKVLVPTYGGIYREISFGEVKYLNPIIARSDIERSISRLIYSGLVKIDEKGEIIPDMAENYRISESGLEYDFILQQGVSFSNGEEFDSEDVKATINAIKNPEMKSPYMEKWADVEVLTPNKYEVIFRLDKPYGPFIYNCLIGISDSKDIETMTGAIFGTGPYQMSQTEVTKEGFTRLRLSENKNYFWGRPYISEMDFDVFKTEQEEMEYFKNHSSRYEAISAARDYDHDFVEYDFQTGRSFALIPNLSSAKMKSEATRKNIFEYKTIKGGIRIKIVALDNNRQRELLDGILPKMGKAGVSTEVLYLAPEDLNTALLKKDFDLYLYGCDFGYDRDLYANWHSSQIGISNYSGYSNKASDIFLEDARLMTDGKKRNDEYDKFMKKLKDEGLVSIFPKESFGFGLSDKILGVSPIVAGRPEDRFNNANLWYMKYDKIKTATLE